MARALTAIILSLALAPGAWGATFQVDATFDAVDANPGDGVCASATGECTLRAAVMEANAWAGADEIVLEPTTHDLTIPAGLLSGDEAGSLSLLDDVTIYGIDTQTTRIRATTVSRVLTIGNVNATIANLTIEGGRQGSIISREGGGLLVSSGASVFLYRTSIQDNEALSTETCSPFGCGAERGFGSGIFSRGQLTIVESTISENRLRIGTAGGIYVGNPGSLLLVNSTISGNDDAQLYLGFSTLSQILNSTLVGQSSSAALTIQNFNASDVVIRGSILAGTSCTFQGSNRFQSLGFNIEDGSCGFSDPTDLVADPLLAPLADNGGPTPTHALLPGSPSIDSGSPDCLENDQRGVPRPLDGDFDTIAACDRGAFESDARCSDTDADSYSVSFAQRIHPPWYDPACGFLDCDDADPAVHPFAEEVPGDGVDQNCNGSLACGNLSEARGAALRSILPYVVLGLVPLLARARSRCRAKRLIVAAAVSLPALVNAPVEAATFRVDATFDAVDANPGDGLCASETGECTLRAAVMEANAWTGFDVIVLPAGEYPLTIEGNEEDDAVTGDLDVRDELVIGGAGADMTSVRSIVQDRVFHVLASACLLLDLEVTGGSIRTTLSTSARGGGVRVEEGAALTVRRVRVRDNEALPFWAFAGFGGGIDSEGILTIDSSAIYENRAGFGGAAAIQIPAGTTLIYNSTIADNDATPLSPTQIVVSGTTELTIAHSTLTALDGEVIGVPTDGLTTPIQVRNSILGTKSCGRYAPPYIESLGYNVEDGSCELQDPTDIVQDPDLGALAGNGGPTPTRPILLHSPAIDSGDADCPSVDQRGVDRPQDADHDGTARCDRGAYEFDIACMDADRDHYAIDGGNCGLIDCDDANAGVFPGAEETCNGIDDNCNGFDGFDDDGDLVTTCAGDCRDDVATIFPGAPELCNRTDDDCDGEIDEDFSELGTECFVEACELRGIQECAPSGLAMQCKPVLFAQGPHVLRGAVNWGRFGDPLTVLGDVNGDSFNDLAIGALADDTFVHEGGALRIFSGSTGTLLYTLGPETFEGRFDDPYAEFVVGLPDIDGDNATDFAVGIPSRTGETSLRNGAVEVRSGRLGDLLYTVTVPQTTNFGRPLAKIGDVDGDAIADLATRWFGSTDIGLDYIVRIFSSVDGTSIHTISAADVAPGIGNAIANAGDVDGDLIEDVILSATGATYIVSGANTDILMSFQGDLEDEGFGFAVDGNVDLDGDEIPDLIVGAPDSDPATTGAAYVFSGVDGTRLFEFLGDETRNEFGYSVDLLDDLDGDATGDILIGAPGGGGGSFTGPGFVRLFSGSTGEILGTIPNPRDEMDFGNVVSGMSDLDGDELPEFAVGAPRDFISQDQLGSAYLYPGAFLAPCVDSDDDGFGVQPSVHCAFESRDCDDFNALASPNTLEICDNGIDDNCNCLVDEADVGEDTDGDGFGSLCGGDCDDTDPAINPTAAENCTNALDDDCDGLVDAEDPDCGPCIDADGDGYAVVNTASVHPPWYDPACGFLDCDDADPAVHPFAEEVPGDGVDQNCNGSLACGNLSEARGAALRSILPYVVLGLVPLLARARSRCRAKRLIVAAAVSLPALVNAPAEAATFHVDATFDAVDANPGDGLCASETGECTLRAAVMEANALAGADTIQLGAGTYVLTITGDEEDASETGDLDITDDTTLRGDRGGTMGGGPITSVIEQTTQDRVFHVVQGTTTMEELEITGGFLASNLSITAMGGGVLLDSGASLTLLRTTVAENEASGGTFCVLYSCGVLPGFGGGIYSAGTLTIESSAVHSNAAEFGGAGAIQVAAGSTLIRSSTIAENVTPPFSISSQIVVFDGAALGIEHSTLTGAEFRILGIPTGAVPSTIYVRNSIFGTGGCDDEVQPYLVSLGYNLEDGSCGFEDPTDIVGDPTLGPLTNNGGPTPTVPIYLYSPAIDSGDVDCPATDQRGVGRPLDAEDDGSVVCDRGAYEFNLSCTDLDADHYAQDGGNCGQIDCDDGEPNVNPGAEETCNGIDDNCNGFDGFDADGDAISDCGGDCRDDILTIYPGAPELCNRYDDDCDGLIDEDFPALGTDCSADACDSPGVEECSASGLDLRCTPLLLTQGPHMYAAAVNKSMFGDPLAVVGDVDGDGFDDVAIGAPRDSTFVYDGGAVRVFTGRTGTLLYTLGPAVTNGKYDDPYGESITGLPDIDGDGAPEIAIGTPQRNGSEVTNAGAVDVVSGRLGDLLYSVAAGSRLFGHRIARIGDINFDGIDDFAVARVGGNASGSYNAVLIYSTVDGTEIMTLHAQDLAPGLGDAIANGGDIDGDGTEDIIIGASNSAYVVSGATGSMLMSFDGEAEDDRFGSSVAGNADINGDQVPDLLIGAHDVGPGHIGAAYAFSGADGTQLFRFDGDVYHNQFGSSVAFVDDLNGDGTRDILIGAPGGGGGSNTGPGFVRILSGSTGEILGSIPNPQDDMDFGNVVSEMNDFDGDGLPEIIVGAPRYPIPQTQTGSAWLYSGASLAACVDTDGDGYGAVPSVDCTFAQKDCDDTDAQVHPDAQESCFNGIDDDCDCLVDEAEVGEDQDGDGYGSLCGGDCDDADPAINPNAPEDCTNGLDDDCDGTIDGADADCAAPGCSIPPGTRSDRHTAAVGMAALVACALLIRLAVHRRGALARQSPRRRP